MQGRKTPDYPNKGMRRKAFALERGLRVCARKALYWLRPFCLLNDEGKKTNAVKRCPECQAEYRKKYKALKEKERRAKKKN